MALSTFVGLLLILCAFVRISAAIPVVSGRNAVGQLSEMAPSKPFLGIIPAAL